MLREGGNAVDAVVAAVLASFAAESPLTGFGAGGFMLVHRDGPGGGESTLIDFFVEAPGHRKLTTQINIAGDKFLHDDFAFATREGLIPEVVRHTDAAEIKARGLDEPFATIRFDFTLNREAANLPETVVVREHAKAA